MRSGGQRPANLILTDQAAQPSIKLYKYYAILRIRVTLVPSTHSRPLFVKEQSSFDLGAEEPLLETGHVAGTTAAQERADSSQQSSTVHAKRSARDDGEFEIEKPGENGKHKLNAIIERRKQPKRARLAPGCYDKSRW